MLVKLQGPIMMIILLGASFCFSLLCLPTSIIAIFAGIFIGPATGAPIVSAGVVLASATMFYLGRIFCKNKNLPPQLDHLIVQSRWFNVMMEDRATSSFHWCAKYSLLSPVPYAFFSLLVGSKINHLKANSLVSGVFVGSLLHIAGYTLAGAGIGCALINHAIGKATKPFSWLVLISCIILLLLSRYQQNLQKKERVA